MYLSSKRGGIFLDTRCLQVCLGAQEICSSALTVKIISYSRYMCTPKCDDIYVIETKTRVKKNQTLWVLNRIQTLSIGKSKLSFLRTTRGGSVKVHFDAHNNVGHPPRSIECHAQTAGGSKRVFFIWPKETSQQLPFSTHKKGGKKNGWGAHGPAG